MNRSKPIFLEDTYLGRIDVHPDDSNAEVYYRLLDFMSNQGYNIGDLGFGVIHPNGRSDKYRHTLHRLNYYSGRRSYPLSVTSGPIWDCFGFWVAAEESAPRSTYHLMI